MAYPKLKRFITDLKVRNAQVNEIPCPGDTDNLLRNLPFQINRGSGKNVILKGDTAVELGPPDRASFQSILMVKHPAELRNGMITLIGPDITAVPGQRLPFGQVIVAGGEGLEDGQLRELERKQYISDRLPGYMVRSASRRIWARVSRQAFEKGFSFEILGRNLMAHYKTTFPQIETMEIIFITSSDDDVIELGNLLSDLRHLEPTEQNMKTLYGCTSEIDCEDCPNRPICDRIREMAEQYKNKNRVSDVEMKAFAREILSMESGNRNPV